MRKLIMLGIAALFTISTLIVTTGTALAWYCPPGTVENSSTHVCESTTPVTPPVTPPTTVTSVVIGATQGMCMWLRHVIATHVDITGAQKFFNNPAQHGFNFTRCGDDRFRNGKGMPMTPKQVDALPQP